MGNSITSTAQMIDKMKSIADEKTKRFQAFMQDKWIDAMKAERELCAAAVWQGLFNLQLEMLKAAEAEEAAADRFPAYGGRDRDQMEAATVKAEEPIIGQPDPMEIAAIDAGYIKDARDKERKNVRNVFVTAHPNVKVTRHYFYPQDISEAKEGDIWHDLDGRPHFILGDRWIEARGFTPKINGVIHWRRDYSGAKTSFMATR